MGAVEAWTLVHVEASMGHHPSIAVLLTSLMEDTDRWVVWVGRHTLEKISSVPNGLLKEVRNLL